MKIVQTTFRDGRLMEERTWQKFVIIPKGNRGFRVIGLVEVLWKALPGVINQRVGVAVQFHGILHGFWVGRVIGTTSLKANLFQQITGMRDEVLYEVFINLQKVYDTLERELYMDILVGYEFGLRMERILRHYWGHLSMVDRAGRYYRTLFKGH